MKTTIEVLEALREDVDRWAEKHKVSARGWGYTLLSARRDKEDADLSGFFRAGIHHVTCERVFRDCVMLIDAAIKDARGAPEGENSGSLKN